MLRLTLSQKINNIPFTFKSTGIRVYSFEETLYHVYHYWRESADEFLSAQCITWVELLGHTFIASKMKELSFVESFKEQITGFLQLAPFYDETDLHQLIIKLESWESRLEWEKYKERGDYFVEKNEPQKAIPLYHMALKSDENPQVLNNLGVAYMLLGRFDESYSVLAHALSIESENSELLLHFTEAAILSGRVNIGENAVGKYEELHPNSADAAFLNGLLAFQKNDYQNAFKYYQAAHQTDPENDYYVYKMVDALLCMRRYDLALDNLINGINKRTGEFHAKEAEIYAASGDNTGAIKAMKTAAHMNPDSNYYARLAGYYRTDYNPRLAAEAIAKALDIDPDCDLARMENARNKKGLGRTREYQAALNELLGSLKDRYRW